MKFITTGIAALLCSLLPLTKSGPTMHIQHAYTVDSLGACQGVSNQQGKYFLYGDREVGVIREYRLQGDSLVYANKEMKLTLHDTDVINHPTGFAYHEGAPFFIGNSIRLNKEGSRWRAVIYCVDWEGLQRTGTLDGNLINTIEDDACIQGTRPEYVEYNKKWYIATADYGDKGNEVRLYDHAALKNARRTSDKGVLYKKYTCTAWVQNVHWMPEQGWLVLIQNQIEGRKWRFTYVDLAESIAMGKQKVVKVVDIDNREDELEGFTFMPGAGKGSGIAVTSSRKENVNIMHIGWK
ncbi:hypothetical protein [Chitinophaga pinensis]|uniref:Uncharacterized protein n=1 Tax=Chitinophaga pinensis (strain ATCC 43595 / DSM 2588 / LMG 13176 / NBRC 15968 / NCIMB 11800 / UQM 2034) TaxID=485918 RepID=A0A979G9T5_CHIPD|nr:hypothetical protein [Chitinophaga pinensis]ACU63446.1 hypothetical protein Cpin_6034 [Chitinophaga pinensis DSM 2588]